MQTLVGMLKINMSIHTIYLDSRYSQHELFRVSVIPYLDTNRFRPRLIAIQQTHPIPYRAKVLGRALLSARINTNSFWILISGNAEVAFPSTTATTTPAANLPTPGVAAATSNIDASIATTAAVTVTATQSSSTTGASPATDFSTPTAHPKRKVRP
jgi:hypothetical protein